MQDHLDKSQPLRTVRSESGCASDTLQCQHRNRAGGQHVDAEAPAASRQNASSASKSRRRFSGSLSSPTPIRHERWVISSRRKPTGRRLPFPIRALSRPLAASTTVKEAKAFLAAVRAEMPDANHHVYAYRVGFGNSVIEGMSDDGEPSGTSGPPVLAVLRGSGIGDVIVVVTRYFGGTKLGTGGLVRAYSDAARAGSGNAAHRAQNRESSCSALNFPITISSRSSV